MVEVRFRRDSRQRLSSVLAQGHAGWAERGEDIVCAAVSTILQTAELGLHEVAHATPTSVRADARMYVAWPESSRDRASVIAIVRTAELAIEQIARQFPDHVRYVSEPEAENAP